MMMVLMMMTMMVLMTGMFNDTDDDGYDDTKHCENGGANDRIVLRIIATITMILNTMLMVLMIMGIE